MDYYTNMNALEKKLYENGVGGEILADPYVQYATTSTPFLQQKLTERGKRVFLVRNKMSQEDVRWAEEILSAPKQDDGLVRIAYLSGTPSHNKDFATITAPLCQILAEFPQVRLVLAGPLDTNDALASYANQIIRVPFAPRKEYFATVASADITVAPLEIGNAFCEAKSELKFFEAGLFGVPTVASRTGTFEEAITDGTDGFVAGTDEEWYQKLKTLVTNIELRQQMSRAARTTTLARYTTENGSSPEYYTFLQNIIKS
jgi:glycosyltransferase involved in cell wall biosynthesis